MPRATGSKCVVKTMSSPPNARVIGHFRRVPVREQSVSAQIFVHLDKVQLALWFLARARGAGLAIADDAALPRDPAGLHQRPQAKNHAGRVAAGIGHQPRARQLTGVKLRQAVNGFLGQFAWAAPAICTIARTFPDCGSGTRRSNPPRAGPHSEVAARVRATLRAASPEIRCPRRSQATASTENVLQGASPQPRRRGKISVRHFTCAELSRR